jgi:CRP-like cAMP-binding protein
MKADQTSPNGRNRLLAEVLPIDFALLAPHLRDAHYNQGTLLQNAGDPIERVYFPHSGMISVLAVMQAGNCIETATVGREGAVGAMAGSGGRSATGRAVVQVEGTSSHIAASRFESAVNESPGIRDLVVRYNDLQIALIYQSAGLKMKETARHSNINV